MSTTEILGIACGFILGCILLKLKPITKLQYILCNMDKSKIKYFAVGFVLYFGIAMVCYFLGFLDLRSALTLGAGMLAADYVGERIRMKE